MEGDEIVDRDLIMPEGQHRPSRAVGHPRRPGPRNDSPPPLFSYRKAVDRRPTSVRAEVDQDLPAPSVAQPTRELRKVTLAN